MSKVGQAAVEYQLTDDLQCLQTQISFIVQDMDALVRSCSAEAAAGFWPTCGHPNFQQGRIHSANSEGTPIRVTASPEGDRRRHQRPAEGARAVELWRGRFPPLRPRHGRIVLARRKSVSQQIIMKCHRAPSSPGSSVSIYLLRSTRKLSLHETVSSSASLL